MFRICDLNQDLFLTKKLDFNCVAIVRVLIDIFSHKKTFFSDGKSYFQITYHDVLLVLPLLDSLKKVKSCFDKLVGSGILEILPTNQNTTSAYYRIDGERNAIF